MSNKEIHISRFRYTVAKNNLPLVVLPHWQDHRRKHRSYSLARHEQAKSMIQQAYRSRRRPSPPVYMQAEQGEEAWLTAAQLLIKAYLFGRFEPLRRRLLLSELVFPTEHKIWCRLALCLARISLGHDTCLWAILKTLCRVCMLPIGRLSGRQGHSPR